MEEFKYELGEIVKLRGAYSSGFISARGILNYLEGHSIKSYVVILDGEKRLIASEQELVHVRQSV